MTEASHVDIILVGGGPACVSAAVQLSRSGREILVISPEVGGCVQYARKLENLAGFPTGIPGSEFAERLRRQMEHFHVPWIKKRVTRLDFRDNLFQVRTKEDLITASTLIVGSGTRPELLSIPGEDQAIHAGRVIHYPENLDSRTPNHIIIVGGGDVACEYALTIAEKGVEVQMQVRGSRLRALDCLQNQVLASPTISIRFSSQPLVFQSADNGITLRSRIEENEVDITTDAILVAIGRGANLDFFSPELRPGTNPPRNRFYLVGDAAHPRHRQVAMAIGDGMRAAMKITTSFNGETDEC